MTAIRTLLSSVTSDKKTPLANPDLPAPPKGKYPAKDHCRRVAKWIAENGGPKSGVIVLEGQSTKMVEDDDQEKHFRQRRHFFYLTGCDLPDCFFAYDIKSDHATLWIPPIDPEFVMWAGLPLLPEQALEKYDVDRVLTTDEFKSGESLSQLLGDSSTAILAIKDRIDPSVFSSAALKPKGSQINYDHTRNAIEACRVVKDAYEIALIRHANIISSYAHEQIFAVAKRASNERELNAVFVMHCHANGCREQAYGCICASGSNAATLHYHNNDVPLGGKLNFLIDAGAEYSCYCSDITRTFPLTGRWTKESKEIYDLVLRMQTESMGMIRAGARWEDVHMRSHHVAAQGLRDLGILKKECSIEEILKSKVTSRFYPHGLGHYLGMDTHDVGGNANYEDEDEFFRYLRIRGTLPANSVVTNEPGIYFRKYPFEAELKEGKWDAVVDQSVLARYWDVGGVRIEDDIWVKEGGCENLTTVTSSYDEVEKMVLAG